MDHCSCEYCTVHGTFKACQVRDMIVRITQLELAIADSLTAKSELDCLKCIHVFRVLMGVT